MRNHLHTFQWCPGCGNFLVHVALQQAFQALQLSPAHTVVVTGIGCNSKMSQYLNGYGAETLHGRGIPFAIGVKMANPKLTVISLSGDGDSYGIGLGHLLHAARRNIDIVHITCDNQNYALTTGQASPTTEKNRITRSTPQGNPYEPFDILQLVKSAGAQRVQTIKTSDGCDKLKVLLIQAIQHPGFSHLHIQQECPSRRKET